MASVLFGCSFASAVSNQRLSTYSGLHIKISTLEIMKKYFYVDLTILSKSLQRGNESCTAPEVQDAERSSLYTSKFVKARHSGMDCRNPGYMDVFKFAIPGIGYPLPGGYDELRTYLCITMSAGHRYLHNFSIK